MLHRFQRFLNADKFDYSLEEATEEIPYERLLLFIGSDTKERGRVVEITATEQLFSLENKELPRYWRVQFLFTFPFKMEPEAAQQVGSLLHFLNRQIDLPGFEMSEIDDLITYRHALLVHDKGIDKRVFQGTLGMMMLVLDLFGDTIERVATGEMTFDELLQSILDIASEQEVA